METAELKEWRDAVARELEENILPFWGRVETKGGYLGGLNDDLTPCPDSPIGLIMVARLLWTYARAYRLYGKQVYLDRAEYACRYLTGHFEDREYGGYYWTLDPKGRPHEIRKQVYGQAFVIYGMSEYYMACGDEESLARAEDMFIRLEHTAWNRAGGGYWEAFGREWGMIDDLRLSGKDLNAPFTMNTHLHIMEAYASLLSAKRTPDVEKGCRRVLKVMLDRILVPEKNRFGLFYSADWELFNGHVSPGHDIEGSWLLWETAEIIGDEDLLAEVRPVVLAMAEHTLSVGVDSDGGILDEIEDGITEGVGKSWWPQAEAVIGFLNAYQMTGAAPFLMASANAWNYIRNKIIDRENGEWFEGRHADGRVSGLPKAGPWKSSYHNGRMGFEMARRLNAVLEGVDEISI